MFPSHPGVNRRSLLIAAAAGAAGVALAPGRALAGVNRPVRGAAAAPDKARNVIFMVADGMSTGTLTLGHLVRQRREQRGSHWINLWNQSGVRRAMASTHSADSLVTDSAAGASAWGIGSKVPNASINIDARGRQHLPILVRAKQAGKATGLVTTTRVTHATPSGFTANVPHRDLEAGIAGQILERRVDVIMGGGWEVLPRSSPGGEPEVRRDPHRR